MASAQSRRAAKSGSVDKNKSFNPKDYSMKGQGRSAAYRGAANKAGRAGMSLNQANRAGIKADRALNTRRAASPAGGSQANS